MPGVIVNTGVRAGSAGPLSGPFSTMFIIGTAERGPVDATLVGSMAEFKKHFGDFTASGTLHQHLEMFFEEGGTRAYIGRLVGGDAATGTADLGISTGGTGTTAIALSAANPGSWASDVSYDIVNSSTYFTLTITHKGATVLSSKFTTNAAAIKAINTNLSHLVTASAGASETLPATQDGSLADGDDDLAGVDTAVAVAGLEKFDVSLGSGVVVMPGYVPTETVDVYAAMRDHAVANRRLAFCGFDSDEPAATAIATVASYEGNTEEETAGASHLAFFWPQVKASDGLGGTRNLSSEVFAAAARCRAHVASGPWVAGAGVSSVARFVTGLTQTVTRAIGDELDAERINALRVIDGAVRVYGARSASADETNFRFYTYRDTINAIASQCDKALERFVFAPIDSRGVIFAEIAADLNSILATYADRGGLYALKSAAGTDIDPGYIVNVGSSINPASELAQGRINAQIGVRVASVAELITLTITKSSLTAPV